MNKQERFVIAFSELLNRLNFLNRPMMEDRLKGYKSSEIHCIETIEKNGESNVTKLSESLYMTRGAISKLTKKLVEKGLLESYQKLDNKKEIYFRLTEQGKVIYKIHEELHKEFQERDQVVFDQVPIEQFESMLRFVDMYNRHLDVEIKKQTIEMKSE